MHGLSQMKPACNHLERGGNCQWGPTRLLCVCGSTHKIGKCIWACFLQDIPMIGSVKQIYVWSSLASSCSMAIFLAAPKAARWILWRSPHEIWILRPNYLASHSPTWTKHMERHFISTLKTPKWTPRLVKWFTVHPHVVGTVSSILLSVGLVKVFRIRNRVLGEF